MQNVGLINVHAEDGKELNIDVEKCDIKDVAEEVDRHSRILNRQGELTAS